VITLLKNPHYFHGWKDSVTKGIARNSHYADLALRQGNLNRANYYSLNAAYGICELAELNTIEDIAESMGRYATKEFWQNRIDNDTKNVLW